MAFPLPRVSDSQWQQSRRLREQYLPTTSTNSLSSTPLPSLRLPLDSDVSNMSIREIVRNTEVMRGTPQYDTSMLSDEEKHGEVGYQLPPDWRSH